MTKKIAVCAILTKIFGEIQRKIVYSSIAQSVERMTVNHDVTGSSPVGGANERLIVFL